MTEMFYHKEHKNRREERGLPDNKGKAHFMNTTKTADQLKIFALVMTMICSTLLTGCASIDARDYKFRRDFKLNSWYYNMPPVFKGVYCGTIDMGTSLISPAYPMGDRTRFHIIAAPFSAADLPLSLVVDLLCLYSETRVWIDPNYHSKSTTPLDAQSLSNRVVRFTLTLSLDNHIGELSETYFVQASSNRFHSATGNDNLVASLHPREKRQDASVLTIVPNPNLSLNGSRVSLNIHFAGKRDGATTTWNETIEIPLFSNCYGKSGQVNYKTEWEHPTGD
jgi:hypothetical protein